MSEYYLISQLPSLDGLSENTPLPITEERFFELCNRFLGKKAKKEIEKLTLLPAKDFEKTGSAFIDAWNNGERNLRIALAEIRAGKMKKTFVFLWLSCYNLIMTVTMSKNEAQTQ